jgi:hypothetical protein
MKVGRHQGIMANEHIRTGSNSYKTLRTFKYLGSLLTNQNPIHEKVKCRQSRKFVLLFSQTLKFLQLNQ